MFDPSAVFPKANRQIIYLGACLIAGMRLAREKHIHVQVLPTMDAIEESVDVAHEIFNIVFQKMPEAIETKSERCGGAAAQL